jgi:hypothetical protein
MERSLQDRIWQRAGHRCEYCQVPQSHDAIPFEIDHIIAEHGFFCISPRKGIFQTRPGRD